MAKIHDRNVDFPKWISKIKSGNISEVLTETKGKSLHASKALDCIIAISNQAYKAVKKGVPFDSPPNDIQQLSQFLSGLIKLDNSNATKYFSSMYHIMYFFFEKGHLENLTKLFTTIVHMKKEHADLYQNEKTVNEHLIFMLNNTILKIAPTTDQSNLQTCVSMLLEMLIANGELQNGKLFLKTVLQLSFILSKQNPLKAVNFISVALKMFNKVDKIKDVDLCLPWLFSVFKNLFIYQSNINESCSPLVVVSLHLDEIKWKFADNVYHKEFFTLLCNVVQMLKPDCSEAAISRIIQDNNDLLQSFLISSKNSCKTEVCLLTILLLKCITRSAGSSIPQVLNSSLLQFFKMLLNIFFVLKETDADKGELILLLSAPFALLSSLEHNSDPELFTSAVPIIAEVQPHISKLAQEMLSTEYESRKDYIRVLLIRCANLIRSYYLAALTQEAITIGKGFGKFICSLPAIVFQEPQNQKTALICFTFLASSLAAGQLDKALESTVALLLKCPQVSSNVFKLWGDLKHNALCENDDADVDTTVWTILTEGKSEMSKEWGVYCDLSDGEIANFLLEELKTYFVNKSLRKNPVILVADALLELKTDILTRAKTLIIAMDIASASDRYQEKCFAYYNQSKTLVTNLPKQKKRFDPVSFNSCMGDLLFGRLRCKLKYLRKECETEVIKLSVEPLVTELPENRPDPNDTCDINLSNLSLYKHRKFVMDMDFAIEHWELACSLLKQTPHANYDLVVTLKTLCDAGSLLRLYGDGPKQAKVWRVLYDMSAIVEDINMVVTAVGELLNIGEEVDPEWIENARKQLKNENLKGNTKRAFLLNSALHCLIINKINDGLELLKNVEPDVKKNNIQFTLFLLIIGEYQKRCDWGTFNHTFKISPEYHYSFHKALCILLYLVEESKWATFTEACQIQFQLLQVACLLGESKWLQDQPREARCYLKSQISLAQKLALPLRTAQLLLLLAWVDMSTGIMDDCAVKMSGLEELLELSSTPVHADQPTHSKGLLLKPAFLSHPPHCHCFHCTTTEYRRLVLETATLQATFCSVFGQASAAFPGFEVAICTVESMSKSNKIEVIKSHAHMWMRYTDYQFTVGKFHDALATNEKVLQLLSSVHDPNILQHAIEQKSILQDKTTTRSKPSYVAGSISTLEVEKTPFKSQDGPVSKTPANNNLPPAKSPLIPVDKHGTITPFVRPIRPIKLFSNGEEENTPPVTKSKRKTKLPRFVIQTPQNTRPNRGTRTPFVIVDDEGNPAAVSNPKSCSSVKKRTLNSAIKNIESNEKNSLVKDLLPDLASPLGEDKDNIVRKSKRTNAVKTYGKAKLINKNDICKDTPHKNVLNCNDNGNVFAFHELKSAIDNISHAEEETTQTDSKTDCDFVEGTPPENQTFASKGKRGLRPKKC